MSGWLRQYLYSFSAFFGHYLTSQSTIIQFKLYICLFKASKILIVLLVSLSLANLTPLPGTSSRSKRGSKCQIQTSTKIPGKLIPNITMRNLTCTSGCSYPVTVNVAYAVITVVTKPLVIGCRETKDVKGTAGFQEVHPQFYVRRCKSTHKPISKKISIAFDETTLKAKVVDFVVDCVARSK